MRNRQRISKVIAVFCLMCGMIFLSNKASAQRIEIVVNTLGNNTSEGLQPFLDMAKEDSSKSYYIKVPAGTYYVYSCLRVYSNTYLDLTGCTFKVDQMPDHGYMLQIGNPKYETEEYGVWQSTCGDGYLWGNYDRGKNITIVGGTFDAGSEPDVMGDMFTFSHVKNIHIKGVTFKARPTSLAHYHMIEFAAAKNVKIEKCTFNGNQKCRSAVQLESARKGIASMNSQGPCDGTKSADIQIKNCYFQNMEYGFGTNHGTNRESFRNIVVKNNLFQKIKKYAICVFNYRNCKIQRNRIKKSRSKSVDSMILKLGKSNKLKLSKNKAY